MSDSVVAVGDKLHVVTRRFFEDDVRRHFAGEVTMVAGGLCEIRGHSFVYDGGTNEFVRRMQARTRVFSLGEAGHIVTRIPSDVPIDALEYRYFEGRLAVTDGGDFVLDIHELVPLR